MSSKSRMFTVLLAIAGCLCLLLGRLLWIQAFPAMYSRREIDLVRGSVMQRQQGIVLDTGRGNFADRHLRPLTGKTIRTVVLIPDGESFGLSEPERQRLLAVLNQREEDWRRVTEHATKPRLWLREDRESPIVLSDEQVSAINAMGLSSVRVVPYRMRYHEHTVARHLLGFIGEHPQRVRDLFGEQLAKGYLTLTTPIGGSGLEKTFEPYLQGIGGTSVSFFTDGRHRQLQGLQARWIHPDNPFYPLTIVTTLDADLQGKIEQYIDKAKLRQGSVVVLDVRNADIVAMASRPAFDPYDIDLQGGEWMNRAVKSIAPGSIFKTVVAAAALEHKVAHPDEQFVCDGEYGKYGFSCWLRGGHGAISFRQGFAESCNLVFAQIMERLNAGQLEETAAKLGVGQLAGWAGEMPFLRNKPYGWGTGDVRSAGVEDGLQAEDEFPEGASDGRNSGGRMLFRQLDGEERGQIFAARTDKTDEGVLVQTSIGQRDVRMTPLQAANMVVTLLHGGEARQPRAVREIRFRNGGLLARFPEKAAHSPHGALSRSASGRIAGWMEDVVDYGTGRSLQKSAWKLAGKSGTAQLGGGLVHQWFVGYGPADKPRYAVAVVAEQRKDGSDNQALAVFRGVMDILADAGESGI